MEFKRAVQGIIDLCPLASVFVDEGAPACIRHNACAWAHAQVPRKDGPTTDPDKQQHWLEVVQCWVTLNPKPYSNRVSLMIPRVSWWGLWKCTMKGRSWDKTTTDMVGMYLRGQLHLETTGAMHC